MFIDVALAAPTWSSAKFDNVSLLWELGLTLFTSVRTVSDGVDNVRWYVVLKV